MKTKGGGGGAQASSGKAKAPRAGSMVAVQQKVFASKLHINDLSQGGAPRYGALRSARNRTWGAEREACGPQINQIDANERWNTGKDPVWIIRGAQALFPVFLTRLSRCRGDLLSGRGRTWYTLRLVGGYRRAFAGYCGRFFDVSADGGRAGRTWSKRAFGCLFVGGKRGFRRGRAGGRRMPTVGLPGGGAFSGAPSGARDML